MAKSRARKTSRRVAQRKRSGRRQAVTTELVVQAVAALGSRTGSSYKDILNYLQNSANLRASSALAVKVAVSRGVKNGSLVKSGAFFKVPIAAVKARKRSAKRKGRKRTRKTKAKRTRKTSAKKRTKKAATKRRKAKAAKKSKSAGRKRRAGAKARRSKGFAKRPRPMRKAASKRKRSAARPKARRARRRS